VFLYLFSLSAEENISFFGFLFARKKRETKKVKKVCLVCFLSSSRNFFSSLMKNERTRKSKREKSFLKIVQTKQLVTEKTYHLPSCAVPKNAQEEALGSDIASETLLDSPERRGGASS